MIATDLDISNICGPYGKPYKDTITIGTLAGGEHFLKFTTLYPIIGTPRPLADFTDVLIKIKHSKFLVVKYPNIPDCLQTRYKAQMDLVLSTLEIKYPKHNEKTSKKDGGAK